MQVNVQSSKFECNIVQLLPERRRLAGFEVHEPEKARNLACGEVS